MIRYTKADQLRFDEYHKLLARMEPRIFRAFTDALASVEIELAFVEELFAAGKIDDLMRLIGFGDFDRVFAAKVVPELEKIARRGQVWSAQRLADDLPGLVTTSFQVVSPLVAEAISQQAAFLIVEIGKDQQAAVRRFLLDAFEAGQSPQSVAASISDVVGLNSRQARTVGNFGRAVDDVFAGDRSARSVERAYRLSPKIRGNRDKIKERYAARQLRHRGRVIARQETIKAFSTGRHGAWDKMEADGILDGGEVVEWVTTPDERACPICVPLHGERAVLKGGAFLSISGPIPAPPAHVGCRCDTILVLNPDRKPKRTEERREADKFLADREAVLTEASN